MKKMVTSAGLVALGAATTLYGYDPDMTRANTGRPWSVSATVRGFYDDNPTTSPDDQADDSFGFEVSPSARIAIPLDQTFLSAAYTYSYRYYEDRQPTHYDQSHQFDAMLRHAFGPRHEISLANSFVATQEPSVVDSPSGIITSPVRTRTESDVLRNRGTIDYSVMLTEVIGLGLGYVNTWYDYEQEGTGSRSALLDRLEHLIRADLRWQLNPSLVGLIGYEFGLTEYTGDELLGTDSFGRTFESEDRDNTSHKVYLGADHDFSDKLRGSIRLGAQFTDYEEGGNETSPYADASLAYRYMPGSVVRAGIRHARNATDQGVDPSGRGLTVDQESTALYAQVSHQITRDLTASVLGQAQQSTFNGGAYDDKDEMFYMIGLNLDYRITRHWAVEAGYNFDLLDSELHARDYDRNRVYVGVRATY